MNLQITEFQVEIMAKLMKHGPMTTYELSRALKKDFWKVQQACRTLYFKVYVDSDRYTRKWSLHEEAPKSEDFGRFDAPDGIAISV